MKKISLLTAGLLVSFGIGYSINRSSSTDQGNKIIQSNLPLNNKKIENMKLGAFSVSLNVKDLKASKEFYETLGFSVLGGAMEKNYLIMKNENSIIGLFQGMFEGHILTFNPGWDENAKNMEKFQDVREIQKQLKSKNIKLTAEADEKTTGPASIMISDPDGNVIYIDQHR